MLKPVAFRAVAFAGLAVLAACASFDPEDLPELGDFRLGHNVVLAEGVTKGPFSRDATPEELSAALADAIEKRLIGYDGDGLYHLGVSIGGYVLAQPGVPVVYTPKSVMIFEVTVFDNATGERLNEEPFRITAFEGLENSAPVVGSGLVRSKEQQLANLAAEGARILHNWLIEHADWFTPEPGQERTEFDRELWKARLAETLADPQPAAAAETSGETGTEGPEVADRSGGTVSAIVLPAPDN